MFHDLDSRKISLWIISIILVVGMGYGLWNGLINKGTLSIASAAPFSLQIDTESVFTCQASPCELKVKAGPHLVMIRKDGFIEAYRNLEVPRGSMTSATIELEKIVKAEVAKERVVIPVMPNPFVMQTDKNRNIQALVKKSAGKDNEVIAYFSQPIQNAKIETGVDERIVWVLDQRIGGSSIYQVQTEQKTRTHIYSTTDNIRGLVPSQNGRVLAVLLENRVDLLDTTSKIALPLNVRMSTAQHLAWKSDTVLLYLENTGTLQSLKRVMIENISKPDVIHAWNSGDEVILEVANDPKNSRLLVKGKNRDYVVAY